MFKRIIKDNFNGCSTREDYLKIRLELKRFGEDNFRKELEVMRMKFNPFAKIIAGKGNVRYTDYGDFILTIDKFDNSDHYLLLPKDISYFNVLTLKREDLKMLETMKKIVSKHMGEDNVLFFHCYPFNSIHSIHLHIVKKDVYKPRSNDLTIDDVIYVLENENIMVLNFPDVSLIDDWFKDNVLSLLNIYIISLILVQKTENTLIDYAIDFVLDYLLKEKKIDGKVHILEYFKEEKETLEDIGKTLLYVARKPELLETKK